MPWLRPPRDHGGDVLRAVQATVRRCRYFWNHAARGDQARLATDQGGREQAADDVNFEEFARRPRSTGDVLHLGVDSRLFFDIVPRVP